MSALPGAVRNHLAALRMLLILTVITGILYPLAVTGIAQAALGHQADGPGIPQACAYEQADTAAKAPPLNPATVRDLVPPHPHHRALGFLGQSYVDVVQLNLALAKTA